MIDMKSQAETQRLGFEINKFWLQLITEACSNTMHFVSNMEKKITEMSQGIESKTNNT
jgi:hypothetical protein